MFNFSLLIILLLAQILALMTVFLPSGTIRRFFSLLSILVVVLTVLFCFWQAQLTSLATLSWVSLILFQIVNIGRIAKSRISKKILSKAVWQTGAAIMGFEIIYVFLVYSEFGALSQKSWLVILSVLNTGLGLWTLYLTAHRLNLGKTYDQVKILSDDELPTISVLIPARNEDIRLSDCIYKVLKNDYPKLEVLVLDDCSQDKTSDIIKSFAHDGVRFIKGDEPKDNWLPKNQAYQQLAEAASGEWLLFIGVDVELAPNFLRNLFSNVINQDIEMVSLSPLVKDKNTFSGLIAPLRKWWEVSWLIPKRPPVLSTSWLIKSSALKELGSMGAVMQSVFPEGFFAKNLNQHNKYLFLQSSDDLSIVTNKNLVDKYQTALLHSYPRLKRRLIRLIVINYLALIMWLVPIYLALNLGFLWFSLAISPLVLACLNQFLLTLENGFQYAIKSSLLTPFLLIQELVLLNMSAYNYEFGQVMWKSRNVCYPILHITPKLPKF